MVKLNHIKLFAIKLKMKSIQKFHANVFITKNHLEPFVNTLSKSLET